MLAVVDLEPATETVMPPVLICGDVLYRGGVHTLTGAPDCGKTTLACWWMLRAVREGGSVLFLDEEGGREIVVEKFQALGAKQGERIGYIQFPSRSWDAGDIAMLSDILAERRPDIVAWDSSAAFLARAGLDENAAADVTRFYAQVLTRPPGCTMPPCSSSTTTPRTASRPATPAAAAPSWPRPTSRTSSPWSGRSARPTAARRS